MQTLELSNYGAVELSFDEQKETDGGFLGGVVASLVAWAIIEGINDWQGNKAAFHKGVQSTK